jgi:hypothetical protein
VKYDTVIGTIGNTHGVSSDSAPTDIASQMKLQRSPSAGVATATATGCGAGVCGDAIVCEEEDDVAADCAGAAGVCG